MVVQSKSLLSSSKNLLNKSRSLISKCKQKLSQVAFSRRRSIIRAKQEAAQDGFDLGEDESTPLVSVSLPVLESVFEKLNVDVRVSSHTVAASNSVPLRLPLLLVRSCAFNRLELITDHAEFMKNHVLVGIRCAVGKEGVKADERDAYLCGRAVALRLSGVKQLWLDSHVNSEFVRGIVDVHLEREEIEGTDNTRRFYMEQLTVIGSKRSRCFDSMTRLILLSRHSLVSIRLRRVRLLNPTAASFLWSAVAQCSKVQQLQYEPTRLDTWSRGDIVQALKDKQISSLILTGVEGLSAGDLVEVASSTWMSDLSVVGELIRPSNLLVPAMKTTLEGLSNLLIQMDTWFSLSDCKERAALLELLLSLKENATLEVVQVCNGGASEAARLMSYWIELAQESDRTIKLKLEEITQERMDAAMGRLLRKVECVKKCSWSSHSVSISMGHGAVIVLDEKTWFGEEEE